jgi:hypothetical protein
MAIVIFWILLGACCAIIAPARGRSAIGWLVLGILFSVFALIVLLALPSRKTAADIPRPYAADEKTCPQCAEQVKRAARVCRFCGYKFPPESAPMRIPPAEEGTW